MPPGVFISACRETVQRIRGKKMEKGEKLTKKILKNERKKVIIRCSR